MKLYMTSLRCGVFAAALTLAPFAHASIAVLAGVGSFSAGSEDTFNDLAVNNEVGSPLSRTANGLTYSVTGFSAAGSQLTELYGAEWLISPNAYDTSQGALSTDNFTDFLRLAPSAGSSLFSLGFTLYGSQNDNSVIAGAFTVKITNALAETVTSNFTTSAGASAFVGYNSTAPIVSLTITNTAAATSTYITIDNLYLASVSAVPEPASLAMFGLGALILAGRVGRANRGGKSDTI